MKIYIVHSNLDGHSKILGAYPLESDADQITKKENEKYGEDIWEITAIDFPIEGIFN